MRSTQRLPSPVTETQIADLARRVAALERTVAGLARRRTPTDSIADARLLSALAIVFGTCVFTARDVLRSAAHQAELREALSGAGPRALGAWLRRLHRQPTGSYTLHRIGRDDRGTVWALAVCADMHTSPRRADSGVR